MAELSNLAMIMGNSSADPDDVKSNLIYLIDSGVCTFGITPDDELTIMMWNFLRGEYQTLTPENFDTFDLAVTMQAVSLLMSRN